VEWSLKNQYWCIARGSAGGSLVCWYLQISQIDPIRWKLPVERFIDYSRPDMPDIDLDFDARHRDKVFDYLKGKYGDEHCAQIAALSTYRAKAALDAIGNVCDLSPLIINTAKRLLPELDDEGEGIKASGHLQRLFTEHPEARQLVKQAPDLWLAAGIEGQIKTHSIHAAGFVVDRAILADVVGIIERPKHPRIIACDKDLAAEQGMLKIDALSSETLSAVAEVLAVLGQSVEWLYRVPLDDRPTYELLCSGRNMGVFQMKGHTTGRLLLKLQPSEFNDLIALAALGRPGPLQSGGTEDYIKRKHRQAPLPSWHDAVMEVLLETYGVVIYQEQVMEIAMKVGQLSVGDAHKIRKLISKSGGSAALEKYHVPYMDGARSQNVPDEQAERVWEMCKEAGDYVFNKAHGAAYAQIGYWTAYLKTHHPTEFTVCCANHEKKDGFQRQLLREFRQYGGTLKLLDPNESQERFSSPAEGIVVGGFQNIKGVGCVNADTLVAGKPYRDWMDFYRRCPKTLRDALQATKIHENKMDLDVALAIAPWFVEVEFGDLEREVMTKYRCEWMNEALARFESKRGSRTARIVARITDVSLSNTKKGKPGASTGRGESMTLSLTDPTASMDVRFAGWKWKEIMQLRNPLVGNTEGKGNLVLVDLLFSPDWSRVYGENIFLIRETKGYLPESVRQSARGRGARRAAATGQPLRRVRHPLPGRRLKIGCQIGLAHLTFSNGGGEMGKKAMRREHYAHCQRLHALQRARERLGVSLELSDLAVLKSRIQIGIARRLGRTSKTRTLYELKVAGRWCWAVWDRKTQEIVTFLTMDMEINGYDSPSGRYELLREKYPRPKPRRRSRLRDREVFDGTDDGDL
jgi:hypothetical protein